MSIAIFNIAIILLVLLIAYWWANQGLFSAILHLVCVIVAGAITFAVWEPLTVGLLLRGNGFDDYAWGVSFISIFAISLLVLRVIMDKSIGANVKIPNWANLTFGLPVGAIAGVLTIGMVVIGAGFIQSSRDVMGFQGWGRAQNGRVQELQRMWVPVHRLTYQFYSLLSVGSLYPSFNKSPLRQYYPDMDVYAVSLVRDSVNEGRGKLSLRPEDAQIVDLSYSAEPVDRYAVKVLFKAGARDFGEQLTLSNAQIRLIGEAKGTDAPKVAYPVAWTQYDGHHFFDASTEFISSEAGQAEAGLRLEFDASALGGQRPKFIQIRGTRYRFLPELMAREVTKGDYDVETGPGGLPGGARASVDPSAPSIQAAMEQTNSIRPITASVNTKPAGIDVNDDKYITGGDDVFERNSGDRPGRNLIIKGIIEHDHTRIVQVNVSPGSPANIFAPTTQNSFIANSPVVLVDSSGRTYKPVGYMHETPDNKTRIKIDFQHYIESNIVPALPASGGQTLKLLFEVTDGANIVGLKFGDTTIGTCALLVKDPKANANATAPARGGAMGAPGVNK